MNVFFVIFLVLAILASVSVPVGIFVIKPGLEKLQKVKESKAATDQQNNCVTYNCRSYLDSENTCSKWKNADGFTTKDSCESEDSGRIWQETAEEGNYLGCSGNCCEPIKPEGESTDCRGILPAPLDEDIVVNTDTCKIDVSKLPDDGMCMRTADGAQANYNCSQFTNKRDCMKQAYDDTNKDVGFCIANSSSYEVVNNLCATLNTDDCTNSNNLFNKYNETTKQFSPNQFSPDTIVVKEGSAEAHVARCYNCRVFYNNYLAWKKNQDKINNKDTPMPDEIKADMDRCRTLCNPKEVCPISEACHNQWLFEKRIVKLEGDI